MTTTTRTVAVILLTAALSKKSFAQSFHPAFQLHFTQKLNAMLDSLETPHLRVNIEQTDKANMKFRIAISNPTGRRALITIRKKDDVYLSENVSGMLYANIFDFNQMEDGEYEVIVIGGKEKVSTNITIRTETQVNRQAILH